MPSNIEQMAEDIVQAARGFIERAVEPMLEQLADLKKEQTAQFALLAAFQRDLSGLPTPKDGKDADPAQIASAVENAIAGIDFQALAARALELLPKPKDGEPGKDADPALVAAMVKGAVDAIPKPKDGASVPVEEVQKMVADAVATLPPAKHGEPGRDAIDLEILPAIDPAKSFPRGTYAKHANGLWRAFERTNGMRGWECLVAGVADIQVNQTEERKFTICHLLSDGTESVREFALPVAIYRGVFVEGRTYEPGDQVSWGAHQWHCNETTTEKPIEAGKAWTLSVKRGREGKQGPMGPQWHPPEPVKLAK